MESDEGSSMSPEAVTPSGVPSAGPGSSSLGKLRELPIGIGTRQGDPDGRAAAGAGTSDTCPLGEPRGVMKIPNRDSGIDSPSSSITCESFPCEEGTEVPPGPALLGLHSGTAVDSQTPQDSPQEEADSDVGEEPDPENSPARAKGDAGLAQVGLSPSISGRAQTCG